MRSFVLAAVAASVLCTGALFAAEGDSRLAAVLASEKLMGNWVGSWFRSVDRIGSGPNECESAISGSLVRRGFDLPDPALSGQQMQEARKFHTVFARYGDLSTLPNDTAVKAAAIIDSGAVVTVVCGVRAQPKKGLPGAICANIGCKAIDTKSRRRVVAEAVERCAEGTDRMSASMAAIRDACSQAGDNLAVKLTQRY